MAENQKQKSHNLRTVFISSLVVFLFLGIVTSGLILLMTNYYPPEKIILPQITVIAYDTPTTATKYDEAVPSATATIDVRLQNFSKGLKVKIHGTGGDGLRIHQDPGENSPTIYLASEGDLFSIEDGPTLAGGYIWWKIKSLLNEKMNGWAAEDFLQIAINTP
jgi:hypothetical protein